MTPQVWSSKAAPEDSGLSMVLLLSHPKRGVDIDSLVAATKNLAAAQDSDG